jgi:hypothetical protein
VTTWPARWPICSLPATGGRQVRHRARLGCLVAASGSQLPRWLAFGHACGVEPGAAFGEPDRPLGLVLVEPAFAASRRSRALAGFVRRTAGSTTGAGTDRPQITRSSSRPSVQEDRIVNCAPCHRSGHRVLPSGLFFGCVPGALFGVRPGGGVRAGRRPPGGLGLDPGEDRARLGGRERVCTGEAGMAFMAVVADGSGDSAACLAALS